MARLLEFSLHPWITWFQTSRCYRHTLVSVQIWQLSGLQTIALLKASLPCHYLALTKHQDHLQQAGYGRWRGQILKTSNWRLNSQIILSLTISLALGS